MKAWIRSRSRLKILYELGLIENPNVDQVELPLANFPEEKLQLLSFKQREVLKLRFIDGYDLEGAGREMGVTRERIHQVELEALRALLGDNDITTGGKEMNKMKVRNVLGQEVTIFAGWLWTGTPAWLPKFFTKNCSDCTYCIKEEDALRVIQKVNDSKGGLHWQPPRKEDTVGLCIWGVWPKILVSRRRGAMKCFVLGIPRSPKQPNHVILESVLD